MKLWTTWLDYEATGEGRTLFASVAYADGEQAALEGFKEEFGEHYALGAEAAQGVVENGVTKVLFADRTLAQVRDLEGRANVDLFAKFHFNFA
jgi:hypothetical protein